MVADEGSTLVPASTAASSGKWQGHVSTARTPQVYARQRGIGRGTPLASSLCMVALRFSLWACRASHPRKLSIQQRQGFEARRNQQAEVR